MSTLVNDIDLNKALLDAGSTIREAIASLDASGKQIALIVSKAGILEGSVTDGDIRRGFLNDLSLLDSVTQIMNPAPLVVSEDMASEQVMRLMTANKVRQIPVLDADSRVIGLHVLDEILEFSSRPNTLVIMAGGLGTRLYPETKNCPKPMLMIGAKPILERILDSAILDGFTRFIISLNYLGEKIEEYFGDGSHWGVSISYIWETTPLGTAGALSLISKTLDYPFLVTNGDIITDINYGDLIDFHLLNKAVATMAVRQHELKNSFGVVLANNLNLEGFEEKPVYKSLVNAGIYVLSPSILELLEPNEPCDMPTLFLRAKAKSRVIIYPMYENWLDIGRPEDLDAARKQFKVGSI